jgi:hypothetical protein
MKLYVKDENGRKVFLNKVASSRTDLVKVIGKKEFVVKGRKYHVKDVYAAKDINVTITGLVVGGAIGFFAGPIGIAIGGLAGAVIGNGSDNRKLKNVKQFNDDFRTWEKRKK